MRIGPILAAALLLSGCATSPPVDAPVAHRLTPSMTPGNKIRGYDPPHKLGGDQTDPSFLDDFPTGTAAIDDLLQPNRKTFNGLDNIRVFSGGKYAARYFYVQFIEAAKKLSGLSIKQRTRNPNQDAWNSYICSHRFSANPASPAIDDTKLVWISYNEHRAPRDLAWLDIVWSRGVNHTQADDWNSHRIIFLERQVQATPGASLVDDDQVKSYSNATEPYSDAITSSSVAADFKSLCTDAPDLPPIPSNNQTGLTSTSSKSPPKPAKPAPKPSSPASPPITSTSHPLDGDSDGGGGEM